MKIDLDKIIDTCRKKLIGSGYRQKGSVLFYRTNKSIFYIDFSADDLPVFKWYPDLPAGMDGDSYIMAIANEIKYLYSIDVRPMGPQASKNRDKILSLVHFRPMERLCRKCFCQADYICDSCQGDGK